MFGLYIVLVYCQCTDSDIQVTMHNTCVLSGVSNIVRMRLLEMSIVVLQYSELISCIMYSKSPETSDWAFG